MSRSRLKLFLGKYKNMLATANDVDFLRMMWAVNALQSGMAGRVGKIISYPKEAITKSVADEFTIQKWEFETLFMSLMTTPKDRPRKGRFRFLNCTQYGTLRTIAHVLRQVENEEYAIVGNTAKVLDEMHRIAQRQFAWQRGLVDVEVLFRYAYVYGQGSCAAFFKERYGISVSTFLKVCVALASVIGERPWQNKPKVRDVGITQEQLEKVLAIISIDLDKARRKAQEMIAAVKGFGGPFRVAYQPSLLRQFPIITAQGYLIAPLWQLVLFRATAGLYYDMRQGSQSLITEAGFRFEDYVRLLIKGYCTGLDPGPSEKYIYRKNPIDTPDILLRRDGEIVTVFECKATKLTHAAQFAGSPFDDAADSYRQLVKGILQLWRFFSHARRGIFSGCPVSPTAQGVLLTMDTWMQMSSELRDRALSEATSLATADPDIVDGDRRPIAFSAISELHAILRVSDENELLKVFADATQPNYRGWSIQEVRRDGGSPVVEAKKFPLDFASLLPWFDDVARMSQYEE